MILRHSKTLFKTTVLDFVHRPSLLNLLRFENWFCFWKVVVLITLDDGQSPKQ
jgi:hypothetical protein